MSIQVSQSPVCVVQVMIIPISEASVGYAQKVRASLRAAKLHVEVDASDKKMQKKVREAQLAQYNYILVSLLTMLCIACTRCQVVKSL
jgi:threonyl-tRNA synthetase